MQRCGSRDGEEKHSCWTGGSQLALFALCRRTSNALSIHVRNDDPIVPEEGIEVGEVRRQCHCSVKALPSEAELMHLLHKLWELERR